MKLGASTTAFFPITRMCKNTANYVRTGIKVDHRYYKDYMWFVHKSEITKLIKLAKQYDNTVDFTAAPDDLRKEIEEALKHWQYTSYKTKAKQHQTDSYAVLFLLPTAPMAIVEAVWKGVIKAYHPDVGGNSDDFIRMKHAYETIKKEASSSPVHSRPDPKG